MDTTETYIKMCDCPEIQEGHTSFEHDDIVYLPHHQPTKVIVELRDMSNLNKQKVLLPRQDQLQEMLMPSRYKENYDMCSAFAAYLHDKPDIMSMEQLWLAFVMKEKYNKVWSGTEWMKK